MESSTPLFLIIFQVHFVTNHIIGVDNPLPITVAWHPF